MSDKPFELYCGDCCSVLAGLPDNSVDSIVTDPPYHLTQASRGGHARTNNPDMPHGRHRIGDKGFMGKLWDGGDIAQRVEMWAECLRVLKPGGHLLAFSSTRTSHRMVCAIEDAGFEVRDQIGWLYGSGFPKSRNLVGDWQGWGTALKPAFEPVCMAYKPFGEDAHLDLVACYVMKLEAQLWSISFASAVGPHSASSHPELSAALAIAQWTAESAINTSDALCEQMGMSRLKSVINMSLSIASSWRRTMAEVSKHGSTSTTKTKSSTITDWKTLSFCMSAITPRTIIQAVMNQCASIAFAEPAARYFDAELKRLSATLELSALAAAIERDRQNSLGVAADVLSEPICVARKPLIGTVASNVASHGTGALNIDACRVGWPDGIAPKIGMPAWGGPAKKLTAVPGQIGETVERTEPSALGRWPANIIHDGSPEVLEQFPDAPGQMADESLQPGVRKTQNVYGTMDRAHEASADRVYAEAGGTDFAMKPGARRLDSGSAARFFYCAKTSRADRNEGLPSGDEPAVETEATVRDRETADWPARNGNFHPTVKPTDLMAYLCRLVTPPGGVILDPFMGSGSTGKAAMREGFRFIGIDMTPEYVAIARARIQFEFDQVDLARKEATRQPGLFSVVA